MEGVPEYKTLQFIVRRGDAVARLVALGVLLLGIGITVTGGSLWFAVAGIGAAAVAYLIMQSYAELVRVMVDMLLPK